MVREADREKFRKLAEQRVTKVLKQLKLIGNLANRSNYTYDEKDGQKIHRAIKSALDEMKVRFDRKGDAKDEQFKL